MNLAEIQNSLDSFFSNLQRKWGRAKGFTAVATADVRKQGGVSNGYKVNRTQKFYGV